MNKTIFEPYVWPAGMPGPNSATRLQLLTRAREHLSAAPALRYQGICHSLHQAKTLFEQEGCGVDPRMYHALTSRISMALNGRGWLHSWLEINGHATKQETEDQPEKLKATRLAWLDWMIQECEKDEFISHLKEELR